MLWSGLISFIHVLGEIPNGLIAAASGPCIITCMLMSDLTHRSLACKAHLKMRYINSLPLTKSIGLAYSWKEIYVIVTQ